MARKEQDRGRQQSKSRTAQRESARGTPATAVVAETAKAVPRGKVKGRAGTALAACVCTSEFQDARYGKNMRVFNRAAAGGNCTVCGAHRSI